MIEMMAMIEVIPMMTPSTVRKERTLFARIAWNAIEMPSRTSIDTGGPYSCLRATMGSSWEALAAG